MLSYTFPAATQAVCRAGFTPVFYDVDPASWTLAPTIAHDAMRHLSINAIVPVASFGRPLPPGHQGIAENLLIAFSLHAAKPLGIGEGDMVVSGGFNGRLSEMAAAVGVLQLARRAEVRLRRHAVWQAHRATLTTLPEVTCSMGMTDGSGRSRAADGELGRGRKHRPVHRRGHSDVALVCAATARPSTVCVVPPHRSRRRVGPTACGKRSSTRCDVCSYGGPSFAGCAA